MSSKISPQKLDRVGFLLFILWALFMGFHAWRLGLGTFSHPGPGLIPFLAASLLIFVAAIQSIFQKEKDSGPNPDPTIPKTWGKMTAIALSLLVYGAFIESLGFVTTTFFWLVFLFELSRPSRLAASLFGAAITTAVCFILFIVFCKLQLPLGPLGF